MSNQDTNKLRAEVANGQRVEKLYDQYAKEFIDIYNNKCYERFKAVAITDNNELVNIKMLQVALATLEKVMLQDIQTGKLAKEQLKDE